MLLAVGICMFTSWAVVSRAVGLEPPRSWLSVTPSLQHSLTEISSPRPPAYSLNRTLNSLENFRRGALRFCFMVRMRPGINNSLKAPRVVMLCSLNGTHSCSRFHVVGITYSNTGQLVKSQHSRRRQEDHHFNL